MTLGSQGSTSFKGKNYPEVPGHDYQLSCTFSHAPDLPPNPGSEEKYSDLRIQTSQAWAPGPAPGWPARLPSWAQSLQRTPSRAWLALYLLQTEEGGSPSSHKTLKPVSDQLQCATPWVGAAQITLFGEININKWWSFLKGPVSFKGIFKSFYQLSSMVCMNCFQTSPLTEQCHSRESWAK